MSRPQPVEISPEQAREYLVGHLGLNRISRLRGARGVVDVLNRLRCIQLDPLDMIGTNADLVAIARVDGVCRGDVYRAVYPGHAFEHFAKERCILPAHHFPWYRAHAAETPWWRSKEREKRLRPETVRAVLEEIRERGPITPRELTQHGAVKPMDWSGWKGTAKATSMAIEVLWSRCEIVVCGRGAGGKLYDVPERALPSQTALLAHTPLPEGDFGRWALLERVEAAGLLSRNAGPHWSILSGIRQSALPDQLVKEGKLVEVKLAGSPRRYLAPAGFLERRYAEPDARLRILGPLDPLIWDRELVRSAFGFEYVWEVYKPESQRRWGWYVCPLLHRGRLVGRIEARVRDGVLDVTRVWKERSHPLDETALEEALARHTTACGAGQFKLPKRRSWS